MPVAAVYGLKDFEIDNLQNGVGSLFGDDF